MSVNYSVMISVFMTALSLVFHLVPATSETLNFVVEPSVGMILLNPTLNVTFHCQVYSTDHSYEPMWTVYYPDSDQLLSTHNDGDMELLEEYGIYYYSEGTVANITIPGTVENNTEVWCTTLHSGATEFSAQIEIIIAGPPLSPIPNLKVLSSLQLELEWDIPYSDEDYPIQYFDIHFLNTSSGHEFVDRVVQNRYVYNTEGGNPARQCDLLMFSVTAVSELGQSAPGIVSGGFPIAPQLFPSEVNVAVTFYGNGTPIAIVTFAAPFICDYQTSHLTITIEDATDLPALVHLSASTGGCSKTITEIFDTGLLANHAYTLTITASDSPAVEGVSIATVNFSTTHLSALPNTQDLQLRNIAIFAGGVFALLVAITTIIIVTAIVCSRRRNLRKAPGSTMDLMLNRSRAGGRMRGSQYDTPYKSSSSLYETIDGYQKRTPAHHQATAAQSAWKHQQYLRKPQQCNFESRRSGDSIETDTLYQEMHSACACDHVTKPQYLAAPHNHPLKLHACRVEMHADGPAAGCGSDPFYTNDHNDASSPLSQSESFGDHLSTIAVVNESVGSVNGEGDQSEYTYMSQAGTLTGQQSKLTLCTNGYVKTDEQDRDSSAQKC